VRVRADPYARASGLPLTQNIRDAILDRAGEKASVPDRRVRA